MLESRRLAHKHAYRVATDLHRRHTVETKNWGGSLQLHGHSEARNRSGVVRQAAQPSIFATERKMQSRISTGRSWK